MGMVKNLEDFIVSKAMAPAVRQALSITGLHPRALSLYFTFGGLILVVPTAFRILGSRPKGVVVAFVIIMMSVVSYLALARPQAEPSPPIWRLLLWILVLRNILPALRHGFQPLAFLMWTSFLISEYVLLVRSDVGLTDPKNRQGQETANRRDET